VDIERDLLSQLPVRVRDEAARYATARDYGSLVTLLDDYLASGPPPDPAVLLCVALARTWWATEVMVDRLAPSAELALVHVAAARQAGASDRDADPVERFVRTMLDGERERLRADELAEEAAATGAELSVDQLLDRAHRAWQSGRPDEAADLFQDAARQRRSEGARGEFNDEIRAALCLAQAGRFEEARPVLEEALVYDWAAAGIWNDRHMSEHAAAALLREAARSGAEEFGRVWDRAMACAERLGDPFPSIYRIQEDLLELTIRLELPEHCRHVLAQIRARSAHIDAATRAKVEAAEAFLAQS
jgi:tetratricopeptide (TPR) repeat protein